MTAVAAGGARARGEEAIVDVGILSFGAYLPRLRLQRAAVVEHNAWLNPALRSQAAGERSMAGWDEDTVTMAVEAARDCLAGVPREEVAAVHLASTTHPFADRSNAGIAAAALSLRAEVATQDLAGSLRAGTSGLLAALAMAGTAGPVLLAAADRRRARPGGSQELAFGDGAAALLVGPGRPLAKVLATHTEAVDFVDHFRASGAEYDYGWEERWIREEGYLKLVPAAIARVLARAGVAPGSVTHFCLPSMLSKVAPAVARRAGLPEAAVRDDLAAVCGDTGTAHPLLMLAHALEQARPGDRILVAQLGQGCDAVLLEATAALAERRARRGVTGSLARRRAESRYGKLLAFAGAAPFERGMRAEGDRGTALSSLFRNRKLVLGFVGGRCGRCGTQQIPKTDVCVAPGCGAVKSQVDQPFAELPAEVVSFTADALAYTPDPPAVYGMVGFAGGGRLFVDFADVEADEVHVGMPMRMAFRIKDVDPQRGFTRYFWKATPATQG